MELAILKGNVYYKDRFIKADIGIEEGKIVKIKEKSGYDSDNVLDAKGKYVMPGIIDAHVHLRDLSQSYKETFITGAKAAAHGGVTTVINMPNTKPPATTLNVILELTDLAKKACVNVGLFGGVENKRLEDDNNVKNNFDEIIKFQDFVRGCKVYMDSDDFLGDNLNEILNFFSESVKNQKLREIKTIAVHAEDSGLVKKLGRDNKKCEIEAVKFISELTPKFSLPMHVCHVSTPEALEIIKDSDLTCEVTPHHLFLSKGDFEYDAVNPPLRTKQDRLKLWENLNNIDIIATDHAPHTIEEKEKGVSGFPGLETSLPLMLDSVNKKRLTINRLIEMMSEKPAEIFGLKNKGKIESLNNK